jgi:N-acetylmuramoyl-L-alanine amidase
LIKQESLLAGWLRMKKYIVSLGAGHGGYDFGTIGPNGLVEKDVTLSVVKYISRKLAQTGAFDVIAVRPSDAYISTRQRMSTVQSGASLCHVEIHVDLTAENAKSAAVWYCADMPSDRIGASKLSHRLAMALEIPDCGARVRFDYCMLFKRLEGFEDYYSLIEALGTSGVKHVFYCECGFAAGAIRRGLTGRLAGAMAEAVARTICELFHVHCPRSLWPVAAPLVVSDCQSRQAYLKEGFFNLRAGPGGAYAVIRVIEGLIFTGVYEQKAGWLRLSADNEEYISQAAVELYLGASDSASYSKDCDFEIETTGRDGFHFVLADMRLEAGILGVVATGTAFFTTCHGGWRKIAYCDRVGFIAPSGFGSMLKKQRNIRKNIQIE